MNDDVSGAHLPSITARPTPEKKRRFAAFARARGISESALALVAIRGLLESNPPVCRRLALVQAREPATDRITIRLRPGDHEVIYARAAQRGMKTSTYLAALVRAHVAASPPLSAKELAALKEATAILGALGRLIDRRAHIHTEATAMTAELREDLSRTRAVIAALEQRTHDLARAALISWESPRLRRLRSRGTLQAFRTAHASRSRWIHLRGPVGSDEAGGLIGN
jgi:hypothetical protein